MHLAKPTQKLFLLLSVTGRTSRNLLTQAQHRQGRSQPHHPAEMTNSELFHGDMCHCNRVPGEPELLQVKEKLLLPDILPHGHGCNNLLYSFFSLLLLFIIEFSLQFKNLSWQKTKQIEPLGRRKGSGFRDSSEVTFYFPGLLLP